MLLLLLLMLPLLLGTLSPRLHTSMDNRHCQQRKLKMDGYSGIMTGSCANKLVLLEQPRPRRLGMNSGSQTWS